MRQESDIYNRRSNDIMPVRMLETEPLKDGLPGIIAWPENVPDIRDWNVVDESNNVIGTINDLLVTTDDGYPIFASVTLDRKLDAGSKMKLVPTKMLEIKGNVNDKDRRVIYHGSVDDLKNSPDYTDDTTDFGQYYDFWSSKMGMAAMPESKTEAPAEREMAASGRKGGEIGTPAKEKCEGVDLSKQQSIEDISCGEIKKKD